MVCSKAKLKSSGDKSLPCFRPFSIGNASNFLLSGLYYRFCLNILIGPTGFIGM
jgi:hypothetical protein